VTIPYARVVAAEDLPDKGRLSPGDVAFIAKDYIGVGSQIKMNPKLDSSSRMADRIPHATLSSLVGIDYLNRVLRDAQFYRAGHTVLLDSKHPLDDWRSLTFLQAYNLDGVVMSNDIPQYVLSSSEGRMNDQIFNMAIQGPVQLNNGYVDERGHGVYAHFEQDATAKITGLIAGPSYDQYPLQMFDRNLTPLSELFVGLICRKIDTSTPGNEFDTIKQRLKQVGMCVSVLGRYANLRTPTTRSIDNPTVTTIQPIVRGDRLTSTNAN
jgi:hypothetical protein